MAVQPTERTVSPGKAPSRIPRLSPGAIGGILFFVGLGGLLTGHQVGGLRTAPVDLGRPHRDGASPRLHLRARRARLHHGVRRDEADQLRPLRGVHGGHLGRALVYKVFGVTRRSTPWGSGAWSSWFGAWSALLVGDLASAAPRCHGTVAYRPLRKGGPRALGLPPSPPSACSLFLSNLFLLLDGQRHLNLPFNWPHIGGPRAHPLPTIMPRTDVFTIAGVPVQNLQILVIGVALVMLIAARLLRVSNARPARGSGRWRRTRKPPRLMGVNINGVVVMTFFIGGMMAGRGGDPLRHLLRPGRVQHGLHPGDQGLHRGGPRWDRQRPRRRAGWLPARTGGKPRRGLHRVPVAAGHRVHGAGGRADVPADGIAGRAGRGE